MASIADSTVLVTGANRGIGRALVEDALSRGAKRVYAGTRTPLAHSDGRVTPLALDVTDSAQIRRAVGEVASLDVLVNNAGLAPAFEAGCPSWLDRAPLARDETGMWWRRHDEYDGPAPARRTSAATTHLGGTP